MPIPNLFIGLLRLTLLLESDLAGLFEATVVIILDLKGFLLCRKFNFEAE